MGRDDLYITVPSFFRCPISLDVMKSPVSLSTGVTYDRASIQRWLDSGNNTCPATMQVLDTKSFVPNLTLHRLIQIWSNSNSKTRSEPGSLESLSSHQALDLIKHLTSSLSSSGSPPVHEEERENRKTRFTFECFFKLLCYASESPENRKVLASDESFVDLLVRFICLSGSKNREIEFQLNEPVFKIFQLISPKLTPTTRVRILNNDELFLSMTQILRVGSSDSRVAIAGLLESLAPDSESKRIIFNHESLLSAILEVLKSSESDDAPEVFHLLKTLVSLSSPRKNKLRLIKCGGVRVISNLIAANSGGAAAAEMLLTLLEMVAGLAEGRAAIVEDPNCVGRIFGKLMKGSRSANEHGVALLWSLCYLFRDQKAKETVLRSSHNNGGLTKILLLMQSDCSPAVKRMCCDLLRIFRVNSSKSSNNCLSSYDTKTTHIMPC